MSSSGELSIKGYTIKDHEHWSDFELVDVTPKPWSEEDVDIDITHCGVCGSDVHMITGGWGPMPLPLVVGHEIAGVATRVGSNVKGIKVGDRVGVGAIIGSCGDCNPCTSGKENYCMKLIDTYGNVYPDGTRTQGGYATAIRANQGFVFPIPDGLESKFAASMLCAGLTTYAPLKKYGAGPGKKVGVVGIGGLGHFGVLFAKALGAEVYAFTHSDSKAADIKAMGADHVIATSTTDLASTFPQFLDLIICTREVTKDVDLGAYIKTLVPGAMFVILGIGEEPLPQLHPYALGFHGVALAGSHVGSKAEAIEMLALAAEKGLKPWIEELPMSQAKKAVEGLRANKARYRYVLTQDIKA